MGFRSGAEGVKCLEVAQSRELTVLVYMKLPVAWIQKWVCEHPFEKKKHGWLHLYPNEEGGFFPIQHHPLNLFALTQAHLFHCRHFTVRSRPVLHGRCL